MSFSVGIRLSVSSSQYLMSISCALQEAYAAMSSGSQHGVSLLRSSNERRSGRRQLLHGKSERPYSGNDLLLSGLCQGTGDGRQVFLGPDLHRRCEPVRDGGGGGRRIAGTPGTRGSL